MQIQFAVHNLANVVFFTYSEVGIGHLILVDVSNLEARKRWLECLNLFSLQSFLFRANS